MQIDLYFFFCCQVVEGVVVFCYLLLFFVVEVWFCIVEDWFIQFLDVVVLFGVVNYFCVYCMKEVYVIDEFINGFFLLVVGEKGVESGVVDLNVVDIQYWFENCWVVWIFVVDFVVGKVGQCYFVDDLLEGVFVVEFWYIIVSLVDWGDSQFDVIFVYSRVFVVVFQWCSNLCLISLWVFIVWYFIFFGQLNSEVVIIGFLLILKVCLVNFILCRVWNSVLKFIFFFLMFMCWCIMVFMFGGLMIQW